MKIDIKDSKVDRRFTQKWSDSGFIRLDKLPEMVESVIVQKKCMVDYIEILHDKIDQLINIPNNLESEQELIALHEQNKTNILEPDQNAKGITLGWRKCFDWIKQNKV